MRFRRFFLFFILVIVFTNKTVTLVSLCKHFIVLKMRFKMFLYYFRMVYAYRVAQFVSQFQRCSFLVTVCVLLF